jgi:hypothetical protein
LSVPGGVLCRGRWPRVLLAAVGAPHPFFLLLMTIELALPPVLVLLWWRAGGSSASKA